MMFRRCLFLCLLFTLGLGLCAQGAEQDAHRVKIQSNDPVSLRSSLEVAGFDVAGHNRREGIVEVIVSSAELRTLMDRGLECSIVASYKDGAFLGVPAGYRDYNDLVPILYNVEASYPQIAQVINVGIEYGIGTTHEGRHLYAMKISDNVWVDEDEPSVWLNFNHHAREIMTMEFGIWVIEELTSQYGVDPDVTRWVDHNQIYVGPCWNPDGKQYCHDVYEWWRKNRKPFGGGDYGVDLNRNYDFHWYGPYSGSTDPGSDTYKGPYPDSEEETQAEEAFAWDRHFAKQLDFHSYGRETLYTYYLSSTFPAPLEAWYRQKAEDLAWAFNYGGWYRKPSAEGEHYQWELHRIGTFSFLVETGYEFQPSYSVAQTEWSNYIWPGIRWFLDHEIPLRGHVTEAITGNPIEADITIAGINYTEGEIRKTEPKFGRFHYFLPPGNYDVTFTAAGYAPKTYPVTITAGKSFLLEAQLGQGPVLAVSGHASQTGILDLDFDWPAGAGQKFMNGVSFVDTGFTFKNGVHVPVGVDFLYLYTLGTLPGWSGQLDGAGHASALLPLPHDPTIVGLLLYMAYFTMDPVTYKPTAASAAAKIFIDA